MHDDHQMSEIDGAIRRARKAEPSAVCFAAASNSGGNADRAYPANRPDFVICVHASDGQGNNCGINPPPTPGDLNLTTLGISVASEEKGQVVHKTGTSFATPIAAALVANMLEIARYCCQFTEEEQASLHDFSTINKILHGLVRKMGDGYQYLSPQKIMDIDALVSTMETAVRGRSTPQRS
jgi:hypothetical protein